MSGCVDCARPYGDEHGFPDLIIPYSAWKLISPSGDDGGLLCPSCICKRLVAAGIRCEGAFMSGPIISVSQVEMSNLGRVENIELAIEGRDNRWAGVRELVGNLYGALDSITTEIRAYQSPECDDEGAPGAAELKAADAALVKARDFVHGAGGALAAAVADSIAESGKGFAVRPDRVVPVQSRSYSIDEIAPAFGPDEIAARHRV